MLKFKQYLTESEDIIAWHLNNSPKHKKFLHDYLKNNREVRSKYLGWVVSMLDKDRKASLTAKPSKDKKPKKLTGDQLGSAIDWYHESKHNKEFLGSKEISKYGSHIKFHDEIKKLKKL